MQPQSTQTARPATATPANTAKAPKPPQALYIPELNPGDRYAGIELDSDGNPTAHLVLLAARPTGELNHQAATEWAASVGGTLPTRQEQSLLFANCKPNLPRTWCWSCETHEESASYAWHCDFSGGYVGSNRKSYEGGAVAVRRLVIQSFNTSEAVA